MNRRYLIVYLLLLLFLRVDVVFGVEKTPARKVEDAVTVIKEMMATPEKGIPEGVLSRCYGIGIFPGVIKAGFVIGGRYGEGVILKHDPRTQRWSGPAFFTITGGSIGWQIGAQSVDLILVFMTEEGIDGVLKSKFTLGADASIAGGPVGRRAGAELDATLTAAVLSYSRTKGLFIGLSLEGAVIKEDKKDNQNYYSRGDITVRTIFDMERDHLPQEAKGLVDILSSFSR